MVLTATSCEYEAQVSYAIEHRSSGRLTAFFTNTNRSTVTDTITIEVNGDSTIAINGQGIGLVRKYAESGVTL